MKKKILAALLACCMCLSVAACGKKDEEVSSGTKFKDGKFVDTVKITVEVYDRGNDGGSDPTNNMYTDFIKKGMKEKYNVEVEFVAVSRWEEVQQINNLLAGGTAPDICLTYDYPTIQTYAGMDGVLELNQYLEQHKDKLPNLYNWLGDTNIYWDQDPNTGELWAIEGKRADIKRINTFVRQDWLDKLGMKAPTTKAEFEKMLVAFKDNAKLLLGDDADKMIPFSVSYDVGWRAANIIESFIDPAMTDKEFYVNGFDDRMYTQNGTKEAIRLLNKWYNDGLMWDDFALYGSGDSTEDDMIKAGYVGAFMHNWDYPFRNGEDSIQANLKRIVGEDAAFVAIDCFENSDGEYAKRAYSSAGDRKIFFPATNDEPLASLLYLDWISTPENIQYLQIGDEGVTHTKLPGGGVSIIPATGNAIQNSGQNIDLTITCNGLNLMNAEDTAKSAAYNYAGVDPSYVQTSIEVALNDAITVKNVNVGAIAAEEGMGTSLGDKRDIAFDKSVIASPSDFDKVWDDNMKDYLKSGGQKIMDERKEKWEATFGTSDMLP
ncbi:MAG: extracellular solute-binding protein [Lachnospiraceae bacterium]|nr:extracellular solute-binding protein [Lachnospiraceae bacterium]